MAVRGPGLWRCVSASGLAGPGTGCENARMSDAPTDLQSRDTLTRFLLARAGLRGAHVDLTETWQAVRQRGDYPEAVADALGRFCAVAALFTSHIKVDGRLSVQARGEGAVRTLFAECTSRGGLRAIARHDAPADIASFKPTDLGPGAVLAITIETQSPGQREPQRYQGMVDLLSADFDTAFEAYFQQSEQLPSRLVLAVSAQRAVGLLLQQLPADHRDPDGWDRANALLQTLGTEELHDTEVQTLLWRLFHEEDISVQAQQALGFACSCSRERVEEVLTSIGEGEALASLEDGTSQVQCEFCGQQYRFSEAQVRALFQTRPTAPGSERLN